MTTTTGTCGKCDGKGSIRGFEHVANGACFNCGGTGIATINVSAPKATRNVKPSRTVQLESLNLVAWIHEVGGYLRAELNRTDCDNSNDAICGWIELDFAAARAGRVEVTMFSDGVARTWKVIAAALQAKIKA